MVVENWTRLKSEEYRVRRRLLNVSEDQAAQLEDPPLEDAGKALIMA